VALGSVGVAFLIRYWLTPILGEELPFMLFIAAALFAAWYGGAPAGITALLLGLFLADFFFVSRLRPSPASHSVILIQVIRYLFTASLGIALIEVLHRGRRRTERALEELKREIARRQQSEAQLLEAQQSLRTHAANLEHHVEQRTAALGATVASLQEVLYNIAHHLRAPLRSMSSFSQILLDEYAPKLDAAGREFASTICTASARMDLLARDLLEYGRLAHIEIKLTVVNLDRALAAALARLLPAAESAKAEIIIERPLPDVMAHLEILQKVMVELVDNAIKFTRPGVAPRLRIWAERRNDKVRLWFDDNGPGIDPRYHERIFGVFERLHPQEPHGTGIGLALVKQGMHRLGGDVGVESQPGHGSRFWVDILSG
jgi:signal transduction histidine kinase